MKFLQALVQALALVLIGGIEGAWAQTTPAPTSAQQPNPSAGSGGKVIFSRSIDENGQVQTQASATQSFAAAPTAEDAERQAVTFTAFDMDVRLRPEDHAIAVRALLTVRNDGKATLSHVPLQLSSTLNWDRIRLGGKDVLAPVAVLNSDSDHTGQLHEAGVTLPQPLAPGAEVQLDVAYSGNVGVNARRLISIGTPEQAALRSDWDRIEPEFTGLRGFGNVLWYPASSVPVILGDGARLFDEIGEQRLRLSAASFKIRLTVEFKSGKTPTVAFINGHPVKLAVTEPGSGGEEVSGIASATSEQAYLGPDAPSLFVATRREHTGANLNAWTLPENEVAVQSWIDAETDVTPFVQGWLGQKPHARLTLLDLPDPQDAPFETGTLLVTGLHEGSTAQLDGVLVHALTHAWMEASRAWLSEGLAQFMSTLWVEKQQGREKALGALEAGREALALAEPASPGDGTGQPLPQAISPAFYRTKAAYVFWMLRDIVGDPVLSAALRALEPGHAAAQTADGKSPAQALETLLEQASHHDLSWFFADWVIADKGLPDLTIDSVFPSSQGAGNWLVAVNLSNAGFAAAEVPVIVTTPLTAMTQRVRVPGRGKVVQRILIQGRPSQVQVNDGTVPESQASVHVTHIEESAEPPTTLPPASPRTPPH